MRVLIAEDDDFTREGLVDILEDEGYEVLAAGDGRQALKLYFEGMPDFVCLDIMMPQMSGYEVCREIRKSDDQIPIIFLSAKSEEVDKVTGLELGADDYISKPFGIGEMTARIRALTRRCLRSRHYELESFRMFDIEVFPERLLLRKHDEDTELNLRDVKILQLFHNNNGRVLSRSYIFKECWGLSYCDNTRSLDVKISQLRKLIESDPGNPKVIRTVHGAGYLYEEVSCL